MTREEYLRELQTGLEERLTKEETADIVAEYAGFFESGREEGRSEEDVASALGSPAGLVRMLAGEKAGQGPAFPVSPPAAPVVPSPIAAASPASVFPPRASFGRRVGAYLIDRRAVFLIVALLIAAAVWLSSPGTDTGTGGAASQIQAHLDDGSAVRAEAPMVIAFGPLLLLLSILAPQLGFPLILLFFLRSPINPETYKAEAALLTGVMLVGLLLTLLYKPVLECLWNGRTLGKRLMGIRVAAPDGGKAGAGRIFVRELVGDFLLGGMTGGITTIVSIFTASIGREHKSVPDYIASSIVVTDRKTR